MNSRRKGIVGIVSLLLILLIGLDGCSETAERRVLLVQSYEETYAGYSDFYEMLVKEFEKEGIRTDIRTIYLDCESYLQKQELKRMYSLLDSVSSGWQPDIILVNEDQATYSLLQCGAPLVSKVPVVFAGVNYPNWELLKKHPNVTGLHDKIDYLKNVEVAKELLGDTVNLFTILDSTFLDRQIRQDAREQFKGYKITGFFDYPEKTTLQQLELCEKEGYMRFRSIPVRTMREPSEGGLIWALSKYGKNQCYVQVKRDFTTVNIGNMCSGSNITAINEAFGYNERLLGGYFTTLPTQVKEQVKMAVRILNGERASNIPITESRKDYVVDWNVMVSMGVKKEKVPAYYKIIHIPLKEKYPVLWFTSLSLLIIFLLALFSCLLWLYLREQKRKKRAQSALANEKETLSLAIEGGTTYVWTMENGEFVFEDAFWLAQGRFPHALTMQELESYVHPEHLPKLEKDQADLPHACKKISRLRCNFNGEGYQWWEFRYTTKLLADGQYKTAGLLLNIQDIKDREEELEAARLLAEKAELKESFLANMSHEIRTPLNSIVGFANILAVDEELAPEERQEYIDTINKNSDLLLKLVNDILELSRIESGYMSFSYAPCLVKELVDDIYMTHQVLITPRLEFVKEEESMPLEINVDKDRLKQVLTNFLNNSAKFTTEGMIKLGYRYLPEKEQVCLYVEDTGCGIPHEQQQIIFSRFYKQNEFSQGTGLGLSICKVIVEKLGGEIKLKSTVGKGSRFMVLLPCRIVV